MFAPVENLGLVVLWDDGDDLHAEPRAPYPNAREVLALRAHRAGAAALIGGFARTAELAQLVQAGWARDLTPDRATLRATAAAGAARRRRRGTRPGRGGDHRPAAQPRAAHRPRRARGGRPGPRPGAAPRLPGRDRLRPMPRAGPVRALSRGDCNGPLRLAGQHATPDCRWCGALAASWRCPHCGHDKLRAIVTGAARTAEELGRAFPGVKVRTSGGDLGAAARSRRARAGHRHPGRRAAGGAGPTPPRCCSTAGRCSAGRACARGRRRCAAGWPPPPWSGPTERCWCTPMPALPATQALIRWDPVTFAERELADRAELGFPPAVRMAAVTGDAAAVASLLAGTDPAFEVLGPVPLDTGPPRRRGSGPRPDPGVQGAGRGARPGAAGGAGGPQRPQGGRRRPGPARSGRADLDHR